MSSSSGDKVQGDLVKKETPIEVKQAIVTGKGDNGPNKPLESHKRSNKPKSLQTKKDIPIVVKKLMGYHISERNHSTCSTSENGSGGQGGDYLTDMSPEDLEEPFSDSEDESTVPKTTRAHRPVLKLPMPRKRIRTLSGTVPPTGYSPVWGGPTMCLCCLEFFELPNQNDDYMSHLLAKHNIVISGLHLIVDVKRYVEHWRKRFNKQNVEEIFPKVNVEEGDEYCGLVDYYYLLSENVPEDAKLRETLALRRLEEVLACQQREREDFSFERGCLFCRYRAKGNRSKLIHHLYMIHHLNLGSPDNLVFVNEYIDLLKSKLDRFQCIYCEKVLNNHEHLMEHMRKRQHKEVNPRNNYYDKFYVINYLELGKKWLDVIAEDVEDVTTYFHDSDEEDEQETWHEWEADTGDVNTDVVCLLCDESNEHVTNILQHMNETHTFHLLGLIRQGGLDFYRRVKIINYIRAMTYKTVCWVCGKEDMTSWQALRKHFTERHTHDHKVEQLPEMEKWDKEEYLVPVFENDHLLWALQSIFEEEEKEEVKQDTKPRRDSAPHAQVLPEDLPELHSDSALNDPQLREQLK